MDASLKGQPANQGIAPVGGRRGSPLAPRGGLSFSAL